MPKTYEITLKLQVKAEGANEGEMEALLDLLQRILEQPGLATLTEATSELRDDDYPPNPRAGALPRASARPLGGPMPTNPRPRPTSLLTLTARRLADAQGRAWLCD